jgi:pSer/pThr/pTyr-binding forkhead associated (FHA) protein
MPDVVVLALKLAFLLLLWLFVFAAVRTIRGDLAPARPTRRSSSAPAPARRAPAPPRRRTRQPTRLVVTEGSLTGATLELAGTPLLIGRAPDSALVLTDDYASSRHARLFPREDHWFVEDLGSTNGTYIAAPGGGMSRVSSPTPVPVGVPVRIGKTVLELRT